MGLQIPVFYLLLKYRLKLGLVDRLRIINRLTNRLGILTG
jgi:hypothetical protein